MLAVTTATPLKLPTFLASHMALQRAPLAARLWGWSAAGANITATLDGATTTVAMATPTRII